MDFGVGSKEPAPPHPRKKSMSKRILAYVHAYCGHGREAGAETTLHDLLKSLVSAGWEANVVLSEPHYMGGERVEPYWIDGVFVRMENGGDTLLEAALYTDVMISHLDNSERTTYVAQKYDKAMVQLIHNTMWQTEGYIATGPDLLVYNTDWVKKYHEGNENPVASIPKMLERGADTLMRVDFVVVPDRRTTKIPGIVVHPQVDPADYSAAGSHDHITFINFHKNKGPEIFWELAKLRKDVQFLGVLGGYGEQEIPSVVPDNVTLIENTRDMKSVYAATRALLMPSLYESFGRVAIEAAASGVPTIHSDTPGLRESLRHPLGHNTGLMVDRLDHHNISIWSDALDAVFSGTYYPAYKKNALNASAWWNLQRKTETANFVSTMEKLLPHV
jgi:glycosyltransferase involved in cell wall biosynthesis